MTTVRITCFASGIAIGMIRRLQGLQENDSKINPIVDYAVPAVGIAGIRNGMRAVAEKLPSPTLTYPFSSGLISGLIGATIVVYSGSLIGSAIVDVAKEYQHQMK